MRSVLVFIGGVLLLSGAPAAAGEVPPLGVEPGMDVVAWERRRAVLLGTLLTEEYGRRPVERPECLRFEKVYPDKRVRPPEYGMDAVRKVFHRRILHLTLWGDA